MSKKNKNQGKPQVHQELKGFEININEFGQIVSNIDATKMNEFLNKHVDDKKMRAKEDSDEDLLPEDSAIDEADLEENENLLNFDAIDDVLEFDHTDE